MKALTTQTQTTRDIDEGADAPRAEAGQADEVSPAGPASPDSPASLTFADLGVSGPICEALAAEGITTAFPIQALALPIALAGHDIIGQARTGTGKTLAFGIPLLQRLGQPADRRPLAPGALVVVPTRELAVQVAGDLTAAGGPSGTRVITLYGGRAYEPQIEALRATVDVVVGTPGRLLDLVRQHHLDLSDVKTLVLDEADKMLDLGFLPDVERILQLTPADRQTMLFSATMPGEVVTLARRHLQQPMHVRAEQHDEPEVVPLTDNYVFRAHQMDKIEMLARVLQASGRGLTMVFCRTKRTADQVAAALTVRGFAAAAVHGDLGQAQRERALRAFRHGKVDVLVATDVAARGLDVEDVTHVVNYECPEDDKAYLHRTGRTGRAGRAGVAVTFVDWADLQRWKIINETLGLGLADPPETYSTSEHLFTALGIPAGASGKLPTAQRDRAGLEAEEIEDLGETGRSRSFPGRRSHRLGTRADGGSDARSTRIRRRTRGGRAHPAEGDGVVRDQIGAGNGQDGAAGERQAGPSDGQPGQEAGQGRRRRRRRRGRGGKGAARPDGQSPA
jgi:superfamily II DNA/RNA helicase